jgi:hypothetical protein
VDVEESAWKACLDGMAMEGRGFRDFPCWSAVLTQGLLGERSWKKFAVLVVTCMGVC